MTLDKHCINNNLSNAEIAAQIGISAQAVWLHRTGKSIPRPSVMKLYQEKYGIKPESFYNNQVDRNNPKTCPDTGEETQ